MELRTDFDIGAGLPWDEKKVALAQQMAIVVPEFYCPSRRPAKALPAIQPGRTDLRERRLAEELAAAGESRQV